MATSETVVGIDPSLTNTALFAGPGVFTEVKGGKRRGPSRLAYMHDLISSFLRETRPEKIVIEGYAYGATAQHHRLGEIGGVIRLAAVQCGVESLWELPPSSLKKFATGSGRAGKSQMQQAAVARGDFPEKPSHDLADASALWHAGHDTGFLSKKATHHVLGA